MTTSVNVAVLLILGGNIIFSVFRPRQGTAVYVILAFIAPHLRLGGMAVPYEILAFLPVGLIVLYRKRLRIRIKIEHGLWAVYFTLAIAATLHSTYQYGSGVLWIPIFGWARAFIVFLLTVSVLGRQSILWVLILTITVNFVFAVTQPFLPGILDVTHALYSQESTGPLNRFVERGSITRAVGTFGSPVDLAAVALISFGIAYERILRQEDNKLLVFILVLSASVGVLSLSRTAILGIPLVLVLGIIIQFRQTAVRRFRIIPRRIASTSLYIIFGSSVLWYLVSILRKSRLNISYPLSFFQKPLAAFETRYAAGSSGLGLTAEVAMENMLTGVGFTTPRGEFLGDSAYVMVFHTAGVWGILITVSLFCLLAYRSISRRETTMLIPLAAIGITGLSTARLFALPGVLVITYILAHERYFDLPKTFVRE